MRRAPAAIAVGVTLCIAAGGFGAPPLYVAGIGLVLIGATALTWVELAARGARVKRSLGSTVVEEQAPLPVTVSAVRGRMPLPGGELRAWPDGPTLRVPTGTSATTRVAASFARRGRHRLGPAWLEISDPLGLCTRTTASGCEEVLVLPRVEPVRISSVGGEETTLARQVLSTADAGCSDVDSLRPHRPGSPASRIHWPTVARSRVLMERSLTADGERAPRVVVDPRAPSSPEALDHVMRAAASLCVHLARHGGCTLVLPGDRAPTPIDAGLRTFPDAHARLAVLRPEDGGPPLAAVAGATLVLWVTAARSAGRLPGGLRTQIRYVVSPHPRDGSPVEFTVAGCSGQRLAPARAVRAARRAAA